MTLNISQLTFECMNSANMAEFWAWLVQSTVIESTPEHALIAPTESMPFCIAFRCGNLPVKSEKNRIHIDVTTANEGDKRRTVVSAIERGASHVDIGQEPDATHVVLADPEGNEFCVLAPYNSFLEGCGRFGSITCDGSPAVGYFWSKLLEWPLVWNQDEETAIRNREGTGPFITWGPPVLPKAMRNRLQIELRVEPGSSIQQEVERAVRLGASVSTVDPDMVELLDPDDNEFRIVTYSRR